MRNDAGASWKPLPVPVLSAFSEVNMGPTRITQVLFDRLKPATIWVTVEIGGIFRSDDYGSTWHSCSNGLVSMDVHGIAVVPDENGDHIALATTNRGLHRSTDLGRTWTFQHLDAPWQYTRAVVPHPSDPASVFVTNGNGPPGNDGRLLRSRDYGNTFAPVEMPGVVNSTIWTVATSIEMPHLM